MRSQFPFLTIPSVSFPVRGQTVNKCAKRGKERRCETISRSTFKHNFHTLQIIMSIGVRMHLDFNYTVNSAGEKKDYTFECEEHRIQLFEPQVKLPAFRSTHRSPPRE